MTSTGERGDLHDAKQLGEVKQVDHRPPKKGGAFFGRCALCRARGSA
jgi:hypothetical protein